MNREGAPVGATGYRKSGEYTEWFKGSEKDGWSLLCSDAPTIGHTDTQAPITPLIVNKYHSQLKGVTVDVYDVLKAFNVTCPATQHALKKMLCTGLRGHKDAETDLNEAIASLQRAKELLSDA